MPSKDYQPQTQPETTARHFHGGEGISERMESRDSMSASIAAQIEGGVEARSC